MEHFVTIERAIACPRASVAVAAETAAQVLTGAGYRRGLGFGPTSSYVRARRPFWTVVLAVLGAIPTLGLTLFLLRIRTKDHCNVVIEESPYGVVALVSGRVPVGLPAALEAASGQHVASQQHGVGYAQPPSPPVLLAPSAGPDGAPSHGPQAILRPATPVPGVGLSTQQGSQSPVPSFDPYLVPHSVPSSMPQPSSPPQPHHGPPDVTPDWTRRPEQVPERQPDRDRPLAVPVRPPSRLAPPMPAEVGPERSAAVQPGGVQAAAAVPSSVAPPGAAPAPASDDDPISSTSGRVPWVGGGRPGPLPAPPGPAPVSPISRPPGFPPPAPPPPPMPQPEPSGQVATAVSEGTPLLRVDSGELLQLGSFCLLGREPVTLDGDPEAQLVRFDDPKLSVSKTHMAYGVDAQGLWIMDRNSTNGTTVIDPGGRRVPCAPGNRQYVTPGYEIQIGQRRLTVEAPGARSA